MRTLLNLVLSLSATLLLHAQMEIPEEVADTCVVTDSVFGSWYEDKKKGMFRPANSELFTTQAKGQDPSVCDFYKWGAQMFLWLTSPEGDGLVLDGSSIFTLTTGRPHQLLANDTGANYAMAIRAEKVEDVVSFGQAGSRGVLLSQQGSLVYYGMHVNNVYAYFRSGQKNKEGPYGEILSEMKDFPFNGGMISFVEDYAAANYSAILKDTIALTMELKTSWVDYDTVPSSLKGTFVTIDVVVPNYRRGGDRWTIDKQKPTVGKTLALVGMHVVGTVENHPEFVWATFEHVANAPDSGYSYTGKDGRTKEHEYNSSVEFLFMETNGVEDGANQECAYVDGAAIVSSGDCQGGIVPSNTVRIHPWGSKANDDSKAVAENNTLLLSINHSVRSKLPADDVRRHYVQVGSIWTNAEKGSTAPIPNQGEFNESELRGSLSLSNATMETYTQESDENCFSCHSLDKDASNSFGRFKLSHIFSETDPLPQTRKK